MWKKPIIRWLPAVIVMGVIFIASNTPSTDLPNFGVWDYVVKKAGHMIIYGLLALAMWFGLQMKERSATLALILALLYALTDEFHQSFVPGRHPSLVDVFMFDGGGGAIAMLVAGWFRGKSRPGRNNA